MTRMEGVVKLEIVPAATHLFEEPGALTRVATLAESWLSAYLRDMRSAPTRATG
jgi:putative phosphoribosyl transferase